MRIVHLTDYFQPLLGYQETYLAQAQMRNGHDVTVVTSDRYYPFPNYDQTIKPVLGDRVVGTGRREEEGVQVWRLPGTFEMRRRCVMSGIRPALQELRPDVVHTHGVQKPHTLTATRLKEKLKYRLLIDEHSHHASTDYSLVGRLFHSCFRRLYAKWLQRQADEFVGITAETVGIMQTTYGISTSPIHVIPLGVDTRRFTPSPNHRETRKALGFGDDDFVILYTGKIVASKGPHLLLDAIRLCPRHVRALFVGNVGASYRDTFESSLASVSERAVVCPAVAHGDLPRYYASADAGCWPREASIAMLEAAACELPIIVQSVGMQRRISNNNGFAYREGDVDDLAAQISKLASDPDNAREMGRRGRELIVAEFSWDHINDQFERLYVVPNA